MYAIEHKSAPQESARGITAKCGEECDHVGRARTCDAIGVEERGEPTRRAASDDDFRCIRKPCICGKVVQRCVQIAQAAKVKVRDIGSWGRDRPGLRSMSAKGRAVAID